MHYHNTLFLGVNLVGPEMFSKEDWESRLTVQYSLCAFVMRRHAESTPDRPRIVLVAHVDPVRAHDAFFKPLQELIRNELSHVPMLYLNGDSHMWNYQEQFMNLENVKRIMVTGGASEAPVRIEIDLETFDIDEAFTYERHSYDW